MEEDKIYLDLEPTAAQVKKSIEEIVEKLTEDVVENKDKIFTLEVDTENMPKDFDGALTDEILDKVKIRLKTVSAISPVKGKLGQMITSDGDEWIKKSEFYTSLFSNSNSEEGGYTEVRFGPDLIDNPNIKDRPITRPISRLVLSGNPLSLEDKNSSATLSTIRTEQADAKTFKMVIANTAKATFRNSSNVMFRDNANAIFRDNAIVGFKNNINFTVDNNGLHFSSDSNWGGDSVRVTITDLAKVDITGSYKPAFGETYPRVYIHDAANINIDGGVTHSGIAELIMHGKCTINMNDGNGDTIPYTGPSGGDEGGIDHATLKIQDKACLNMCKGAYVFASDMATAYFEKNSKLYMHGGQIIMDGGVLSFNPSGCSPCINMNGGSHIVFNAESGSDSYTSNNNLDPYLIANPTSFIFLGQGSSGSATNFAGNKYPCSPSVNFGGPSDIQVGKRNPQIQIADDTMIIIDAATGGGSNYLKIGACGGGQTQTHILDNTHLELRQNSIISLRGKCQDSKNGPIGDFPITRHNGPPDSTGSMLTMYNDAVFIMRSEWPEQVGNSLYKDHRGRALSEDTWQTNLDFWKRSGSPLFGMTGDSIFKMQNKALIDMNTSANISMNEGSIISMTDGTSININTGSNVSMENSSSINLDTGSNVSMEYSSSINLYNGKIAINEQGIKFEQGENSITFTFSELEQLKALITPSGN